MSTFVKPLLSCNLNSLGLVFFVTVVVGLLFGCFFAFVLLSALPFFCLFFSGFFLRYSI